MKNWSSKWGFKIRFKGILKRHKRGSNSCYLAYQVLAILDWVAFVLALKDHESAPCYKVICYDSSQVEDWHKAAQPLFHNVK